MQQIEKKNKEEATQTIMIEIFKNKQQQKQKF